METIGQRLKEARLALGLSQRQLAGEYLTRNMLSLIENGSASPSLDALTYLAAKLGKPVSYFLEEQTVTSPNQETMAQARAAFSRKDPAGVLAALDAYRAPDGVFDREYYLLSALCRMDLAETAIRQGRRPYATTLLEQAERAGQKSDYFGPWQARLWVLTARADPASLQEAAEKLPSLDPALLVLGAAALEAGDPEDCGRLLDAAKDRESPEWSFLRGRAYLAQEDYERARPCLERGEAFSPEAAAPLLEQCCRELGDYKMAYFYACKQKK